MSSTGSQTRSSIDLGVSQVHSSLQRLQADHSPRIHPARLQHSPSLPNIWFPPHSGPIPREMATNNPRDSQRSSTPPLSLRNDVSPASFSSAEQRPRHIKYASIDPSFRKTSALPRTHARRRTERDQPHALLTPPLTPSSSIRTTASRDSASSTGIQGHDPDDVAFKEEICDADPDSTRFLLIGNVNRQISLEVLESVIVNALIPTHTSSDTPAAPPSAGTVPTSRHLDSPIRGVHLRYLESKGIVPFAFFDIRHAIAAKSIICTRSTGPLELCVGDDIDDDGHRMWFTCRFVSSDELSEIIGNSKFIESSDGAFDLTVQKIHHQVDSKHFGSPLEQEMTQTINLKIADTQTSRGGINIALLHKILKSFGGIRSFIFNRQDVNNEDLVSLVYRVEYYDLREADVAFRELDNQTLFGMKINVSGRPMKETRDSDVPFPNVSSAAKSFDGIPIGPAGSQSLMRIPFFQTGSPKSSASSSTSPQIVSNHRSSPPYFYTSYRGLNTLVPFDHDVGPSGLHGGPGSHGTTEESRPLERRPSSVFHEGNPVYQPDSISPCYTPDGICLYCPSRGSSVAVPFNPSYYGLPSPTPIPALYYPPPNLPQPIANVTPWALTPVPYLRDDYITGGHQYYPSTSDQHIVQQPSHVVAHPPVSTIPPKNSIYVSTRQSSPSSNESASPSQLKTGASMNNIPSAVSDRNQLNLARIEDGQDTRTTVMIKNIPNKMSHADLEAYIAKVCPRRIDFMYLRMDFQNGCNVGYAFVNFILVQDLLRFAQQRLGEKWNMFSSEKVLQMSYANYQGKEALVEKFKNSSIMDEREAWRPRIFYSSGPDQGKPETFPAPTHLRRKERSSHNRGALYVPGVNSGSSSTRRYQEDHQNQSPRRNHLYRSQATR